jgi:uncharacterized protein (TIGR00725 family)
MSRRIMVFGSHSPRKGEAEYEAALALGRALAAAGFDVASGGYGGTMEAVLRGASEGGRETFGYTSDIFPARPNGYVRREIRTATLLDRIEKIIAECDGFVVMKGGTGTLLELAVCWEMVNKKMIRPKPIICLGSFWRPVVETLSGEPSIESVASLRPIDSNASACISFARDGNQVVELLRRSIG